MKCDMLLVWLEEHEVEDGSVGWSEKLLHAQSCPDCARLLTDHRLIRRSLTTLPSPPSPLHLHKVIMGRIEDEFGPEREMAPTQDWLSASLGRLFKPLSLAMGTACLFLGLALFARLNESRSFQPVLQVPVRHALRPENVSQTSNVRAKKPLDRGLAKVSSEEVQAFMRKMKEFQRLHPEVVTQADETGAALVDYSTSPRGEQ